MVYDQNGAARLIRGASLAPPKATALTNAPANAEAPGDPHLAQAPPSYVTGVYDATTWTQPEVPPQILSAESQANESQSGVINAQDSPNPPSQADNGPGQVAVSVRQIAITNENATLELEISAQNPLKNITVVLRAGDFQDVRQAYIPTSQGRVPFLVPVKFATTGIYYEVKDEAQRVLANGSSSLRNSSK
jgi:hypothetical protein